MARAARVFLAGTAIGGIEEGPDGLITFSPDERYSIAPNRPAIGQWFEDHPGRPQVGARPGKLPSFFANYIPEGHLRRILEERLGILEGDDFALLVAVGRDLPGAIEVYPLESFDGRAGTASDGGQFSAADGDDGLRFSLAGLQLKFSLLRTGDRFSLPGRDQRGDWIIKIALPPYVDLTFNEFWTMEWARRAGFEVPACDLKPIDTLVDVPHGQDPGASAFIIERFDRKDGQRIHQEDFQQVLGRPPEGKYDGGTYETLVLLAERIVGPEAYAEMLRRLVFIVASGNNDAHFKNWSLLYRDPVRPTLAPLYDQVFTAQWKEFSTRLALKLGGAKEFSAIDVRRFQELSRRTGHDPASTTKLVEETVERVFQAWERVRGDVPPPYRTALRAHWAKVPLLHPHALLV